MMPWRKTRQAPGDDASRSGAKAFGDGRVPVRVAGTAWRSCRSLRGDAVAGAPGGSGRAIRVPPSVVRPLGRGPGAPVGVHADERVGPARAARGDPGVFSYSEWR